MKGASALTPRDEALIVDLVGTKTEKLEARVEAKIAPIEEKVDEFAEKTSTLAKQLEAALRTIKQLEARERERNEARTRKARITRAANAAGMAVERWVLHCKKQGRDPEFYLEKKLKAPRKR